MGFFQSLTLEARATTGILVEPQNGKNTVEAIVTQVTNGKNAMPPFKGRLKPEQIEAVAAYVLDQADKGW